MLLQLKTSELGGGRNPPPQVERVFKSPGKIGLNQCREKTNLAFDVPIETNVEKGMLFHMPSGKYQSFLKNLEIFHFC